MHLKKHLKTVRNSLFFKSTFTYSTLTLLSSGINFLTLPFMTRLLSPGDFGQVSTFIVFMSVVTPFITIGTDGFISVEYHRRRRDEFSEIVGTSLSILICMLFFSCIVCAVMTPLISKSLHFDFFWIMAGLSLSAVQSVITIVVALTRIQDDFLTSALLPFIQSSLTAALSITLLSLIQQSWQIRLFAQALATLIVFAFCCYYLFVRQKYRLNLNSANFFQIARFGLPLIPHIASGLVITSLDRLIIPSKAGMSNAGFYAAGYQIGMIIGTLTGAVNQAYAPWLMKNLSDNPSSDRKAFIVKATYLYFAGVFALVILVASICYFFGEIIFGPTFERSIQFVLWISLGYGFRGMYQFVGNYLFLAKRTGSLAIVSFICASLHTFFLFILLDRFGTIGAAYATTITFFLFFILTWFTSNRYYPMPWMRAARTPFGSNKAAKLAEVEIDVR